MMNKRLYGGCATALLAAAMTACSGSGGGEAAGSLTLQLSDSPVDGVGEIWVRYRGIRLQPQGGGSAIEVSFAEPVDVDMLTLTDGNTEMLLDGERVPAGVYNWMELVVDAEFDGVLDSYVITSTGGQVEIRVPSGSQSGLRLVSPFTITADQETSFLIDWDMRLGLTEPTGQPGYLLRPALRVIDLTEFGTLTGTVAMELVNPVNPDDCANDLVQDTGNAVYVYDRFDALAATPDDIGGTVGPAPVATADVTQSQSGDYTYEVILSPGDYTVAFTCQAGNDAPETDEDIAIVLPADVTVAAGATPVVNFPH